MPIDRQQLAAIRKLLQHADWSTVRQGLELATSLGDPALWEQLAQGLTVNEDS
jgi:hypothetical protein